MKKILFYDIIAIFLLIIVYCIKMNDFNSYNYILEHNKDSVVCFCIVGMVLYCLLDILSILIISAFRFLKKRWWDKK